MICACSSLTAKNSKSLFIGDVIIVVRLFRLFFLDMKFSWYGRIKVLPEYLLKCKHILLAMAELK